MAKIETVYYKNININYSYKNACRVCVWQRAYAYPYIMCKYIGDSRLSFCACLVMASRGGYAANVTSGQMTVTGNRSKRDSAEID